MREDFELGDVLVTCKVCGKQFYQKYAAGYGMELKDVCEEHENDYEKEQKTRV